MTTQTIPGTSQFRYQVTDGIRVGINWSLRFVHGV
jgi:hypothetical protein